MMFRKVLFSFAFYISGLANCGSPIFYSTVNRILNHDQEQKVIVLGSMMGVGYFMYTRALLVCFRQRLNMVKEQPHNKKSAIQLH